MCITARGLDFKDTITHFQTRDIKGPPAQIKNEHVWFVTIVDPIVESVSESCRCWLVDDPTDIETSNFPGNLGGLSLEIVEMGRNCADVQGVA